MCRTGELVVVSKTCGLGLKNGRVTDRCQAEVAAVGAQDCFCVQGAPHPLPRPYPTMTQLFEFPPPAAAVFLSVSAQMKQPTSTCAPVLAGFVGEGGSKCDSCPLGGSCCTCREMFLKPVVGGAGLNTTMYNMPVIFRNMELYNRPCASWCAPPLVYSDRTPSTH